MLLISALAYCLRANRKTGESADEFKTGVTIGFQPGGDSAAGVAGQDSALGNNSVNFRQVFFDFGSDSFGTVKIGRDLGLFGGDAILADMTLLGVGTVSDLTERGGNTSLGRIGVGYVYADWKAQLQYTSPDYNGTTFSVALVDPWNAGGLSDTSKKGAQESDNFGFEGKINFTSGDNKFWVSGISQEVDFNAVAAVDTITITATPENIVIPAVPAASSIGYTATGFDVGAKIKLDDVEFTGYFYDGEGIGTTGFLLDGSAANGRKRDSNGYYIQATYKPGKTKFGVSYGESNLDLANGEVASALVKTNESVVVGAYHSLNDALTLVAEYTMTESEAHNGTKAEEDSFAIGGIMFF